MILSDTATLAMPASHRWVSGPLLIFIATWFSGCGDAPSKDDAASPKAAAEWFFDPGDAKIPLFVHHAGDPFDFFMPRSLGSGVAILDANLDGMMDVFCLQNAGWNSGQTHVLFLQNTEGAFVPAGPEFGLSVDGHAMGVSAGDLTNDGYPEILVTGYLKTQLFLNLAGQGFRDITAESGLDNPEWGSSCSMLDYNRDGWLDIVVANYIEYAPTVDCSGKDGKREFCGPDGFPPAVPKLFKNKGALNQGMPTFQDTTVASGLASHPGPGLGVACYDFDGDGWVDIFFADDAKPNRLFMNQQNGKFEEQALKRGIALDAMGQTKANMGVGVGDINSDGLIDIFVTHLVTERHTLWQQGPQGMFSDRTAPLGLNQSSWRGTGFGAVMADFDNNGFSDLAFVNGDIRADATQSAALSSNAEAFWKRYGQRNQLFSNQGNGKLVDISQQNPSLCAEKGVGRGLAVGDLNNDGYLDLIVTRIEAPLQMLFGKQPSDTSSAHWISIRATLPDAGGRDDYGAEIKLMAQERTFHGWLNPGASYLCSNDPRVHFGLGVITQVDTVEVRWSDGSLEQFEKLSIDRHHTLQKGKGTVVTQGKP